MKQEIDQSFQEIQVLRALIGKLSFINKESDMQLNEFLSKNIKEVKKKVNDDWTRQK